ncbi:membrane protein [Arthrobacter sp. H5]|uniref:membrane protein n=1 Tax=Arthrobacter sp. H5 TaxID=1267973 RepID=UPI000486363A|nr:membrane protein [Arthrobacter sp. H5]
MTAATTELERPKPSGMPAARGHNGLHALALLRILLGITFLWAFLDKTFGLGFATPPEKSWLSGTSPAGGYLGSLEGPLAEAFRPLMGQPWVDWTFMLGLMLLGCALVLGVALRGAAVGGSLLLGLLWLTSLPLRNNPVIDEHVIYAVALWALATARSGKVCGLLWRSWARLTTKRRFRWLR